MRGRETHHALGPDLELLLLGNSGCGGGERGRERRSTSPGGCDVRRRSAWFAGTVERLKRATSVALESPNVGGVDTVAATFDAHVTRCAIVALRMSLAPDIAAAHVRTCSPVRPQKSHLYCLQRLFPPAPPPPDALSFCVVAF